MARAKSFSWLRCSWLRPSAEQLLACDRHRSIPLHARKNYPPEQLARTLLACEQKTYFRSSLLSLRKNKRSDDRKYVPPCGRRLGRSLAMTFRKGINNVTQLAVWRGQAARLGSNLRNLRNYVIFSKLRKLAISSNWFNLLFRVKNYHGISEVNRCYGEQTRKYSRRCLSITFMLLPWLGKSSWTSEWISHNWFVQR